MTPDVRQQVALIIGQQAIDNAEQSVELAALRQRLVEAEADAAMLRAQMLEGGSDEGQAFSAPHLRDQRPG